MAPLHRPSRTKRVRRLASAACGVAVAFLPQAASSPAATSTGIHKIRHVIVIMQENRSFDSYFGTFPGADGIPMRNGVPTVCIPDPATGECVRPYHTTADRERGGPHARGAAVADIDHGKMDGFIRQAESTSNCVGNEPGCAGITKGSRQDVVAYHDGREIPNYWAYAGHYVLQDHMFEPNLGWSLPSHLFMVSAWSAGCTDSRRPMTCHNNLDHPDFDAGKS
ncbi:MAG: phospholipase, partial [Actinobacteria bacterium]